MEQNTITAAPAINDSKSGNGKGWKIATVIASIVAICGIGLAVYGMIQNSQKDNQISDLKIQITKKDETIASLETNKNLDDEKTLSDTEAQMLIESRRQELGYDTWTTGTAKVTKKGKIDDDDYYWVVYEEKNNGGYTSELNAIFHYEDGSWAFNIPGFSGITKEAMEKYNFKDL